MNYWLTTHWPRSQDTPNGEPYGEVWVKDGQRDVIQQLALGDMVFIYEVNQAHCRCVADRMEVPTGGRRL